MEVEYRQALPEDIPALVRLRRLQMEEERGGPGPDLDAALADYFAARLGDGMLVEWLALDGGEPVAAGAVVLMDFPPSFDNPTGREGYICNMYTVPGCRRRGLAGRLLALLAREARARGAVRLFLGASEAGRALYARFGFAPDDEGMAMTLEGEERT